MSERKSIAPSFTSKVLLPSVMAVAGIALLLLYIVNAIFEETNRLDGRYTERLTASAVESLRENLETIIYDNVTWNEAVERAGVNLDASWIDRTWGYASALDIYDTVMVVNSSGETLYAAHGGKRVAMTAIDTYGTDIEVLLERAATQEGNKRAASGLIRTPNGTSTVAVTEISFTRSEAPRTNTQHNFLIFSRAIDEAVLASVAKRYAMRELRLEAKDMAGQNGAIGLRSPSGKLAGVLTWENRSPGNIVREKFGYMVTMILVMFLFIIAVLLYMSWKGFKEAQDSQADAIAASLRDDLTGLANRRELISVLSACLTRERAADGSLSMVYADLDGFKEVNDSYGHEIGDQLLKAAAAGFAYLGKGAEVIARLGGDEFAMIFTGPDCKAKARTVAGNMISFLAEPMVFDGRIASVSLSAGIVDLENDAADVEEIIRRADVAMYKAKSDGRNRIHVYQKSLDFKRNENRTIALQLREHIDARRLNVVYQPIFDARTRLIKGVEALVRWPTKARNYYTPEVFIPVAEEFGLIEDLGRFVLTEACRQAAQWNDIFVAVNVSPIQFMNPNFGEMVEHTLRTSALDPQRLEIEVTEGFIIDNATRADSIINRLHDIRVRVALDDFGTGFSSIGHLRRFKFDKLKLDRSMVTDILRQPSALRLVQGTIAMADALGLTVVAEGIEDENQVSVLRLAGCSQFQGYLFSKPVEASEIESHINNTLAMAS